MDNQPIILLTLSILFFIGGIIPEILNINVDSLSAGGLCETCPVNMIGLYSTVAIFFGILFSALFILSWKFKADFSFLDPRTKKGVFIWIVTITLLYLVQLIFSLEVVTDDPYSHFLNAKESWIQPILFFELFHKPVYNFFGALAAPFGFFWFRLLFLVTSVLTVILVYLTSEKLGLKNSWIAVIVAGLSPIFFLNSASGLSESLFALLGILGYYLFLKKRMNSSAFFISLMPFVRFEGILFVGIWFVLLILKKEYKAVFFLFITPTLIWLSGAVMKGDLWWVFNENQNLVGSETYKGGKYSNGSLSNYFEKFFYILGPAGAILFQLGLFIARRKKEIYPATAMFFAYFFFHVYSWSFGSFGAMGLEFLMASIVPFGALFASMGFEAFINPINELEKKYAWAFSALILTEAILLFFFMNNFLDLGMTLIFLVIAGVFTLNTVFITKFSKVQIYNPHIFIIISAVIIFGTFGSALLYGHPPIKTNLEHETSTEIVEWISAEGYSSRPLLSTMGFLLVTSPNEKFAGMQCYFDCMYTSFSKYSEAPKGTIIVWDPHYSWQFASPEDFKKKGYNLLKEFPVKGTETKFLVFEKVI